MGVCFPKVVIIEGKKASVGLGRGGKKGTVGKIVVKIIGQRFRPVGCGWGKLGDLGVV